MSTAAISTQSIYQELQSFYQDRQADLSQLGSALQSGDLASAQQAFNDLVTLGQDGPFANAEPFSNSSRAQDFETIGQDLQAGNLSGAQAAFTALTSQQNNAAAQTSAAAANANAASASNATTTGTTSTGSEPSIYQQIEAYRQQRQADLEQLGQDLQAGNVNAAQQDFNNLTALGQTGPFASGQPFQQSDREQDFQAIGQALDSGNLSAAQSAFASLAATFGSQNQLAQTAISAYSAGSGAQPVGPTQAPPTAPPATGGTTLPHRTHAHGGPRRAEPSIFEPATAQPPASQSSNTTADSASGAAATS
jgi:hypothetical protein